MFTELVLVVLAKRRGHTQARAEDEILPVAREFRHRQRAPMKFIEKRNAGSAKPVT